VSAEIIPLPRTRSQSRPIAHYLRIGETGHRQLETLFAEGQLIAKRFVVDASRFEHQRELVKSLQASSLETVLDTKAAELSVLGKFEGYASKAPWASAGGSRPLAPEHFRADHPEDVIGQIARFAVVNGFDAVLAPGHMLYDGANSSWFDVDRAACTALRVALDKEGGRHVAIDYALLISHTMLRDDAERGALMAGLADLPFENLWIRASGFGADGSPAGVRHIINSLSSLHNIGKPIIADYLGGLVGAATVACGAASGLAQGVGERERFSTTDWNRPAKSDDADKGHGRIIRVTIPDFDKALSLPELHALANARGGYRLCVCHNRECCPNGIDDMVKHHKRHNLRQAFERVTKIESVPDLNRTQDFIDHHVANADRASRQIRKLKPVVGELVLHNEETPSQARERLIQRLSKESLRIEKMRSVLEKLHDIRGRGAARSAPVKPRENLEEKRKRRGG
jgi:hypothetical protein